MTYPEAIEYLYNSTPVFEHVGASAYKEGLSNTLALDRHFGHPHKKYKTIHVAGTNGKGSCSHTLASILRREGYKVGLYTSPHLVDFRERIRINGICIGEKEVADFVEKEKSFFEPLHPSFFELTTALAFKYFAEQNVDIAVVEVGLGGRLDCTNIITPVLSVITNISFDHTQFLGDTLAKIAGEKAGIIKKGVPLVVGESNDETRPVFIKRATEADAPVYFAEDEKEVLWSGRNGNGIGRIYHTRTYGTIFGDLEGCYQDKNMNTVLCAVGRLLEMGIIRDKSSESIRSGMNSVGNSTGLCGRWQKIQELPVVVCDTGHNAAGWEYIVRQLGVQKCRQMHIVFGMVDDKDIDTVMDMLPRTAIYYWTQAESGRAVPVKHVAEKGHDRGLEGYAFGKVRDAFEAAEAAASSDDFIFVGGSSYVVADFLVSMKNKKTHL